MEVTEERRGEPPVILGVTCETPSAQIAEGWTRKHLPGPNAGNQQTACVVSDLDGDGVEHLLHLQHPERCDV